MHLWASAREFDGLSSEDGRRVSDGISLVVRSFPICSNETFSIEESCKIYNLTSDIVVYHLTTIQ